MDKAKIVEYLEKQKQQITYLYENLVRIETPSTNKEGLEKLAAHLDTYLTAIGLQVNKHCFEKAGPTLVANTEPTELGPVLLCSHMDTVHPIGAFGPDAFVRDKENPDIVRGPGVYDTKGGIVIALYAIKALAALGYNKRQLKLILVSDEEVAHSFSEGKSAKIIETEAQGCVCCFNCDSGRLNDQIVLQRNGGGIFKVRVHGKSAHAGNNPWDGANAILVAAQKISAIAPLSDYEDTYFGTGVINGGTKNNIVPDYCEFINDIRFKSNKSFENTISKIKEIVEASPDPRVHIEMETTLCFRALEKVEKTDALLKLFGDASEELGYNRPTGVAVGGCSDAAFVTHVGVPTLCGTGIIGDHNHTLEEYAFESSIVEQAAKIVLTILSLPDNF